MYTVNDTLRAVGRMMARLAQERAGDADADGVIEMSALLKPWQAGESLQTGDVRVFDRQPYKCLQAHTSQEGWQPGAAPSLWGPYHAMKRANALPYQPPTHAGETYNTGEWMIWKDGTAYRALRDAVDRGPDELPDSWEAEA